MTDKLIGLDFGTRRIGVAVAHDAVVFARPAVSAQSALPEISKVIQAEAPSRVFVGLPLLLSGLEGASSSAAGEFAAKLSRAIEVPIFLVDERYTTNIAAERLRQLPLSGKRRREIVDSEAAAELLRFILNTEARNPNHQWRSAHV